MEVTMVAMEMAHSCDNNRSNEKAQVRQETGPSTQRSDCSCSSPEQTTLSRGAICSRKEQIYSSVQIWFLGMEDEDTIDAMMPVDGGGCQPPCHGIV
ncbi:hypothetical protein LWI29_032361 [Acer saccharum]|uniref:Uncharacterized protein n=1 Tax=Acer saccharum TaxID=4024 RepID=A0AA39TI49_ACESA|nr:hypothetical protein LWI29_032361 [Acer saccharum]